ncbi:MAG: glycosyltransferase family 2 protein [Hyphomicrobiaceae bacterium]|nr:glycosyltransferase family 2 protein [Hyphomicrobiaceae bacterium]
MSDGERRLTIAAIVPVLDEEAAIADVVVGLLAHVSRVIVVDGGSRDATVHRARDAGAQVIVEPQRGYGRAMRAGIDILGSDIDVVVFVDGDGSDRLEMTPKLVDPLARCTADFVHGTRLKGEREPGSLSLPQLAAGHLAGLLMRLLYGARYTDMSPFRAIRRDTLEGLGMREQTFGWNLEMQMRVAARGLRVVEVPVGQRRRRGGVSKVSGDLAVAMRVVWVLTRTALRLAATLRREASA